MTKDNIIMPDMPKGGGKTFFPPYLFSHSRDLDPAGYKLVDTGDPPASASFWTRGLC